MRTLPALAVLWSLFQSQAPPFPARVVLESIDGTSRAVSEEELRSKPLERLDAILVRFEGQPPASASGDASRRALLRTVEGDTLHGQVLGGEGDVVHLEIAGGARLPILVDRLQSLVFAGRIPAGQLAGLGPAPSGDRLYWQLPGGLDRVEGSLEAFSSEGVRFQGRVLGTRTFPWKEVAALFVEPLSDPATEPAGEGQPLVVDLLDGGRLRGRLERLDGEHLRLRSGGEASVALPLGVLSQIAVADGRIAFLSELEPASVEEGSPFGDDLGMVWAHRRDRSVTGTPLRVAGRVWSRGLGVHAPSRITFAVDGAWRELRGSVAIDDSVLSLSDRGSVRFRVLVDGETRWESDVLRGGAGAVEMPRIDLSGAGELVLEADMATNLHVADRGNWLGMMLVR